MFSSSPKMVIGLDVYGKKVKIMTVNGVNNHSSITVEEFPFSARPFDNDFFNKFSKIIEEYFVGNPSGKALSVSIVLPDNTVALDRVNIPISKKQKMSDSLNIEIENLYKNKGDLKFNSYMLGQNKQFAQFCLTSIKKSLLSEFYSVLAQCKVYSKNTTFAANSTLNAVFAMRPKTKGHSFLFFDMKEDTSKIVLCAKGKTAGFFSLPYGSNMLRSENVVNEFSLYSDDVAELAIINAQEKARAKQLTTSFGEINMNEAMDLTQNSSETENTADGAREDGLSALDAVSEGTKEEEMLDENGFIVYKKPGLSDDDDDEETVNREDFAAAERKQKIYVKKAPKKLPKFMQRPIPETQEETEVENFRIFTKRILLALRACKASNMFFDAEFALLNMPREFGFITERINEEKDKNGIEFRNFLTDADTNTDLIQNLELYGGLFLTNFNKSQNF